MRHLNNLCKRPNHSIIHIIRSFCVLLNALKKPEYQSNPAVFDDWYYLCNYISKNGCTLLAEVIAVANKIDKGMYNLEDLEEICEQYEQVQITEEKDPSFKAVYSFMNDAVTFFKNKNKLAKPASKPIPTMERWLCFSLTSNSLASSTR